MAAPPPPPAPALRLLQHHRNFNWHNTHTRLFTTTRSSTSLTEVMACSGIRLSPIIACIALRVAGSKTLGSQTTDCRLCSRRASLCLLPDEGRFRTYGCDASWHIMSESSAWLSRSPRPLFPLLVVSGPV